MSDLAETMEKLRILSVKAADLKPVPFEDDRTRLFYECNSGQLLERAVPPPPRDHRVDTVADFIAAAIRAMTGAVWNGNPIIWHSGQQVVLIMDDAADRRDRVTLELDTAPQFQSLMNLEAAALTQRQALQVLRIELDGCGVAPEIIAAVRQLRFSSSRASGSTVERGKESFDSDVLKEVVGFTSAHEFSNISVSVYQNPDLLSARHLIRCVFDVDLAEEKVLFRPVPGELTVAVQDAQAAIRGTIHKAVPGLPIFWGTP
jgi:hypothetical protein